MTVTDYNKKKVAELKAIIKKRKLGPTTNKKKAELIEIIVNSSKQAKSGSTPISQIKTDRQSNITVVNIYCNSVDIQSSGVLSSNKPTNTRVDPLVVPITDAPPPNPPVVSQPVKKWSPVVTAAQLNSIPSKDMSSRDAQYTKTTRDEIKSIKPMEGQSAAFKRHLEGKLFGGTKSPRLSP